jgi:hypothetical protein
MEKITREDIFKIIWNIAHKENVVSLCDEQTNAIFEYIKNIHTNDLIETIVEKYKLQTGGELSQKDADLITICLEQFDIMLGKN